MSNYSPTLDRATCRCCTWHNHLFLLTATVLIQTHWWGEFWQIHAVHGTGLQRPKKLCILGIPQTRYTFNELVLAGTLPWAKVNSQQSFVNIPQLHSEERQPAIRLPCHQNSMVLMSIVHASKNRMMSTCIPIHREWMWLTLPYTELPIPTHNFC